MEELKQLGIIPVDVGVLETLFTSYKYPQKKITRLEQKGDLIRLKRGLYVISPKISGKLLSAGLIANHLYGPSYVSMETALRHYGLIPERVHTVASMTLKLTKMYENSMGRFEYIHCPADYYSIGIRQVVEEGYTYLIASPEKALCDLIAYTPKLRLRFVKSLQTYLEEDMRLDMDEFYKMDPDIFEQCAAVSKKKIDIRNIVRLLKK
jgi:Predicted transcriptional regulator